MGLQGAKPQINAFIPASADPLCEGQECIVIDVINGLETNDVRLKFRRNRIVDGLCKRCSVLIRKHSARIKGQDLRRRDGRLGDSFTPFGRIASRRNGEFKGHILLRSRSLR